MTFGFIVHLVGIFCDLGVLLTFIFKKMPKCLSITAYILCGLYTCAFVVWLFVAHLIRFSKSGRTCSNDEANQTGNDWQVGFALKQGKVVQSSIIGVWCANSVITVVFVVLAVI